MAYSKKYTLEERRRLQRENASRWRSKNREAARTSVQKWRTYNQKRYDEEQHLLFQANPKEAAVFYRKRRLRSYGLTEEGWEKLFEAQGRRCGVEACGATQPSGRGDWHIDHCHKTGKVRGILCSRCNHMLGHGRDSPSILTSGANYLEKFNECVEEETGGSEGPKLPSDPGTDEKASEGL